MRVALYARVSSKVQEKKGTIASQIEALRNHATEHDFEIEESYVCTDDGYSGALLARPELDRLRDGGQAGAFDAVLVLSPAHHPNPDFRLPNTRFGFHPASNAHRLSSSSAIPHIVLLQTTLEGLSALG